METAKDIIIASAIRDEAERQESSLEMIPSENYASKEVIQTLGTVLNNKYSEGYPGGRYYGGNQYIDVIERIAIQRAKELFGVSHANVQPYSGSPANAAALMAMLEPGETLMGMDLRFGGHLTHGWKVNFSGRYFRSVAYGTNEKGIIDFDQIREQALLEKPKVIIVGMSAYPRKLEFDKFAEIAKEVGAFLMADIAHIAGLVVAGEHQSPVGFADVITTTTHKTLRGPRGAMILCNGLPSEPLKAPKERTKEVLPTLIDRAVFPGNQGGPHNHQTAAIAVALFEAAQESFKTYIQQVVKNARVLAETLKSNGIDLVTDGTDNHLVLCDLQHLNISGSEAENILGEAKISCNKNSIPHDPKPPYNPSGLRLGTPALTTRGMKEGEMEIIGKAIANLLRNPKDMNILSDTQKIVRELTEIFPIYKTRS